MTETTIHLVFKTHLDIGFTNLAQRVRRQYHEHFIPQAIETGEHFYGEDPANPKFVWTTGAWLIADYLATAGADETARLERAIRRGLIRWHALPFTTHSELMSPALFRAGLSFSRDLDKRFGRVTTAAKMTDVPGHTRGIVPLLAEAGVKFLHLGVNEASPVPDVPAVFRWRANGAEVVVMYQDSYGATHFPEGQSDGLSFAHTNDNAGPQSVSTTIDAYRHLYAQHPEAIIRASTLDEYGELLWARRSEFPIIESEIGDSWIHGVGTDPGKTSRFLALQRLYDQFAADDLTPGRLAFGRGIAMVPEHTWGVDIKTFLRDEAAWDRSAFEAARKADPRFTFTASSWSEQRSYLDEAIGHLDDQDRAQALAAWSNDVPAPLTGTNAPSGAPVAMGGWTFEIDANGGLAQMTTPGGRQVEGIEGSLIGYRYESYDATDVTSHLDSYLTKRPEWAILDHAKPGLERARTARSAAWRPDLATTTRGDDAISVNATLPHEAFETLGAPESVEIVLRPISATTLSLTLISRNKPANRMPEASFLTFAPKGATSWQFKKMGLVQNAEAVPRLGGGQLQAIEAATATFPDGGIEIVPFDTPLIGPAGTPFMVFAHEAPSFSSGVRFNLHNNKWGTNFPMWWEGSFVARFLVTIR